MRDRLPQPEHLREAGLLGAGLLLAGAIAVLAFGSIVEEAGRRKRHARHAPAAGTVPPERHQNIAGAPPR
ncbi:MAG TPA: hypothetical protein VKV26_02255 [Dehalococcoidia bacterium]|nr:hypothetical protein [Dehalococcoidia bacterium]